MAHQGYLLIRPLLDLRQRMAAFEANWVDGEADCRPLLGSLATALSACDPPPGSVLFLPLVSPMLNFSKEDFPVLRPGDVCFVVSADSLADERTAQVAATISALESHLGGTARTAEEAKRLSENARRLGVRWAIIDAADPAAETTAMTLHDAGLRLVATRVDSAARLRWAETRGCALISPDFLTAPGQTLHHPPDLSHLKLLRLLTLVAQDADSRVIEEIFKEDAKLSYNLLRLVNSVAVGAPTRIHSYHQAIAVLGRRQLQRWLQLLIYASHEHRNGTAKPLMHLAAMRGRLLELLAPTLPGVKRTATLGDEAFMVGSFSLLEFVLNMSMSDILAALPLADEIAVALSSRAGPIGELLAAIEGSPADAGPILHRLAIPPELFVTQQIRALDWATRITLD